jgi:predicted enzyme related to lactoylglutathione lyase
MAEAVLYVRDLERMAAFYEACAGLEPGESGSGYRGLRSADWTLWLVAGDGGDEAGPGAVGTDAPGPAPRRSQTPMKLVFAVPSIEAAAPRATELGGTVDGRRWEFGGLDRRDAVDPEGNVIQLVSPAHSPPTS